MNNIVSFEIVKLLEKIGWKFTYTIEYLEELQGTNSYVESIPTIADVVMWIYEKHGIWIWVRINGIDKTFDYSIHSIKTMQGSLDNIENGGFKSPTDAYEKAVAYTLKNLIK